MTSPDANDEALVREARRIYQRYAVEFVEALGLCPWAERSRREGRVDERYVLATTTSLAPALAAIAELSANRELDVGLVVFPRLDVDRREFEQFVGRLREADLAREGGGQMAMAAFHPTAAPCLDTPYRLVPFIRRSPDPTLQLVRQSMLEELRKPGDRGTGYVDPSKVDLLALLQTKRKPPLHERVAEANVEAIRALGLERAEAILLDVARDRDRAYAALGEPQRLKLEA